MKWVNAVWWCLLALVALVMVGSFAGAFYSFFTQPGGTQWW